MQEKGEKPGNEIIGKQDITKFGLFTTTAF